MTVKVAMPRSETLMLTGWTVILGGGPEARAVDGWIMPDIKHITRPQIIHFIFDNFCTVSEQANTVPFSETIG